MDVYAQSVTTAKRKAQAKVVAMLRDTNKKEEERSGKKLCVPGEEWGFR